MPYQEFTGSHDIASYLETLDMPTLGQIRAILDRAASFAREHGDGLGEGMRYGMPCLTWHSKPLISAVATRNHVGVYPYSSAVVDLVRAELEADGIPATAGAIQLPYEATLSDDVVRTIVEERIAAIDA